VKNIVPSFDPRKYPNGRISRAFTEFAGNDWMSKVQLTSLLLGLKLRRFMATEWHQGIGLLNC
jgi:hypothetical protein